MNWTHAGFDSALAMCLGIVLPVFTSSWSLKM